jgi:hypothetical protein
VVHPREIPQAGQIINLLTIQLYRRHGRKDVYSKGIHEKCRQWTASRCHVPASFDAVVRRQANSTLLRLHPVTTPPLRLGWKHNECKEKSDVDNSKDQCSKRELSPHCFHGLTKKGAGLPWKS